MNSPPPQRAAVWAVLPIYNNGATIKHSIGLAPVPSLAAGIAADLLARFATRKERPCELASRAI